MESFNITTLQGMLTFAAYCIPILLALWISNVQLMAQVKVQIDLHESQVFEKVREELADRIHKAGRHQRLLFGDYISFLVKATSKEDMEQKLLEFNKDVTAIRNYIVEQNRFFGDNEEVRKSREKLLICTILCEDEISNGETEKILRDMNSSEFSRLSGCLEDLLKAIRRMNIYKPLDNYNGR